MATFLDGTYAGIPEPDIEHRTVDVRDAALGHVRALFAEDVDGKRIALTNEVVSVSQIFSLIKAHFPQVKFNENKATAEELNESKYLQLYTRNMGKKYEIDNTRSKTLLKMEYIPFERSLVEMTEQLLRNGTVKLKQ
jgi:nucleoside-diphosphate-sugar epimerase